MDALHEIGRVLALGIGATAALDAWLVFLGRMGLPAQSFRFIGRWVGHMFRGRFAHAAITRAEPIAGELAVGWLMHYAIGIGFAALLVGWQGLAWTRDPTLAPAVAVGLCTVLAPLLVMQPAMGAGIASSKTPTPVRNAMRSVLNHGVFGVGLYLSALLLANLPL